MAIGRSPLAADLLANLISDRLTAWATVTITFPFLRPKARARLADKSLRLWYAVFSAVPASAARSNYQNCAWS